MTLSVPGFDCDSRAEVRNRVRGCQIEDAFWTLADPKHGPTKRSVFRARATSYPAPAGTSQGFSHLPRVAARGESVVIAMWSTGESMTEALAGREGDRKAAAAGFASAPKEAGPTVGGFNLYPDRWESARGTKSRFPPTGFE